MVGRGLNYQDILLNHVRKEAVSITVFLTNGYQLRGIVKAFDNYVILMDTDGKQQMIYKHAISTIVPSRAIQLQYGTQAEAKKESKEGTIIESKAEASEE